jgi:hypothetical protein
VSKTSRINSILKEADQYEQFLNGLTEEQFAQTPAPGVWSYSEVYSHIFQSNILSLVAIERCSHGTKPQTGKPTFAGRLILFFGVFPPINLKAPAQIAALTAKWSLEEARNSIARFKDKLTQVAPDARKANPSHTAKHPRLGMLNASQWFRFIEIHSRHHYKQLQRIQKMLPA